MKYLNLLGLIILMIFTGCGAETSRRTGESSGLIKMENSPLTYVLPAPKIKGTVSVEEALQNRRSHRRFQDSALSAAQLSQILWAAYGITAPRPDHPGLRGGLRTTPSAGALFPLEIYVVIGNVAGIEPGVFRYDSERHKIVRTIAGDVRAELTAAALGQRMIMEAPITLVYTAVFSRMIARYGERGRKYTYMEVGHSAQNVYLQAEAMGLGTCAIGAFTDAQVSRILRLPAEEAPLYMMPVGFIR
ncbi:MAG: SagB/ThcOx family dehydrogenase [Spirochaetes bacterium]|nr:SagB/ThcOx family dehydrogenase [Spirochaetota bacterium]